MQTIEVLDLKDLDNLASSILSVYEDKRLFAFYGNMGVGKTTFIKIICQHLGVLDYVNSPTFSILNEYITNSGDRIYHFDFYRINTIEEALNIGFYDYLDSGSYCFIEWAENIGDLITEDFVKVQIELKDKKRMFRF